MSRNFIVLDTEGVDTIPSNDGKPHPESGLFYDLGYLVANRDGDILVERSFVNSDVIFDTRRMNSAYYADKLPQYMEGLNRKWTVADTFDIWQQFKRDVAAYNVRDIWAYNARYDEQITNSTIRTLSNGFTRFFTPYKTRYRDIWDYAGSLICNTKKYVRWCYANGYVSDKGNPSTTAETVYRYLHNDLSFIEEHTALSDAHIELEILLTAFRRHNRKARKSKGQGWRDAAKLAKDLKLKD